MRMRRRHNGELTKVEDEDVGNGAKEGGDEKGDEFE